MYHAEYTCLSLSANLFLIQFFFVVFITISSVIAVKTNPSTSYAPKRNVTNESSGDQDIIAVSRAEDNVELAELMRDLVL